MPRPPFGIRVDAFELRPDSPGTPGSSNRPVPRGRRGRPWGRRTLAGLAGLGLVAVLVVATVASTDVSDLSARPARPALIAPSTAELDRAIARAERYLGGLYKPLGTLGAVQSEYYGLPIRVYFPGYRRWVLAGQTRTGRCGPVDCPALTRIVQLQSSYSSEAYELTFPSTDVTHLRSFRYTVRHATQEAWLYALSRGDEARADALARFMLGARVTPGLDLRATLFGRGAQYPPDLGYEHGVLLDAYWDCKLDLPVTPLAYPYRSKACLLDARPYLWAARHDAFLSTLEALQALNRGALPDQSYPDGAAQLPGRRTTASATADRLEETFDRLGFGIPRCGPLGCDRERASGLRTFAFGALETVLGYRHGEVDRRGYGDDVARLALSIQVGDDAVSYGADGLVYRPALRGGYATYWDRQLRYLRPDGVVQTAIDHLNMPPEYLGVVPTDSETTFDGYAFLTLYRCLKYRRGCPP